MKKSIILSLLVLLLVLCSVASAAVRGTRSNPYKIGEAFTISGYDIMNDNSVALRIKLLEVKRGTEAYTFLKANSEWFADNELKKAEKLGKELMAARVYVKAGRVEKGAYEPNPVSLFRVVDSTGRSSDIISGSYTDEPFSSQKLYQGGEMTGWITFTAAKGDSPLLTVNAGKDSAFVDLNTGQPSKLINLTLSAKFYQALTAKAKKAGMDIEDYLHKLILKDLG